MNFNLIILFFQNNPYTVNVAAAIGLTAAAVITLYKYNHNNKHTPPKSTKRQKEQSSVFLSFLSRLWPMKKMKNFNNILPTHSVDGSLPAVTGQPNSAQETRSNRVNNNPAQTRSNNSSTHTSSHQTERRQPKPSSAPETRSDSNRKKRAQKANVSSEAQTSSEQTQNSNSAPETRSDSNGGEVADSESAIIQAEQAATGDHQSVGQSGRNTDNGLPQTIEATVNTVEANKESTSRAINSSTQTSSHQTERRQPKPSSAPGTRSDSNGGEVADSESAKTPAKKVATGDHQSVGQSERNTDNRLPQTTEATVNRVEANKEATSRAIVLFHPHETDIPYQVIGLFSQVSNHQSVYSLVGDRASTVGQSVLPTTGENNAPLDVEANQATSSHDSIYTLSVTEQEQQALQREQDNDQLIEHLPAYLACGLFERVKPVDALMKSRNNYPINVFKNMDEPDFLELINNHYNQITTQTLEYMKAGNENQAQVISDVSERFISMIEKYIKEPTMLKHFIAGLLSYKMKDTDLLSNCITSDNNNNDEAINLQYIDTCHKALSSKSFRHGGKVFASKQSTTNTRQLNQEELVSAINTLKTDIASLRELAGEWDKPLITTTQVDQLDQDVDAMVQLLASLVGP